MGEEDTGFTMSSEKEKLISELGRRLNSVEPLPEEPDFATSEET